MKLLPILIPLLSIISIKADCEVGTEVICYWGSWSIYRTGEGLFTSENIDTEICTTIVYSFAGLDSNLELVSLNIDADIDKNGFKNLTDLKKINPCLKVVLAVGGWNEGSMKYSIMAGDEYLRNRFVDNVLAFMAYYEFDGLDLDWEYPTTRKGIPEDGKNLVLLLKELRSKMSPYGLKLSIAVPIDENLIQTGYLVTEIADYVDMVNLMAYDYVASDSKVTGLSSPLSEIKETVSKWLAAGLPSKKLALGIPAYAKNFVLEDPDNHNIGAPVQSIGEAGPYTQEQGLLAYFEVLQILNDWNGIITVINVDDTNYAFYDNEWFTFDNDSTVRSKVKYALENHLGGIMLWALELDDFKGVHGEAYPLLKAIRDGISDFNH
ncbi:chitotriosidase-1-like [Diorhabda carinulata]|uniref:chitotriosidase-1-like n=1 Tax=Diorhabda carinulata TaxID=1163345 RepID=UPI0025A16A04|nr:chitotriosidase-1-like [Diorhabda carinulata]